MLNSSQVAGLVDIYSYSGDSLAEKRSCFKCSYIIAMEFCKHACSIISTPKPCDNSVKQCHKDRRKNQKQLREALNTRGREKEVGFPTLTLTTFQRLSPCRVDISST